MYARTSERIYRLILRMTGNPDDAFDLAQNTYLRAFDHIGGFDGRSSLATWLYRIAVNETLQFLRRAERARTSRPPQMAAEAARPATDLSIAQMDVAEALEALEPTDRAVLLLRYQEGLDYKTIAKVTACAEGTVASRLNRARKKMRELLGKGYLTGE
jgi:RNA polymerase sigma-70 factor (ECF subfamily)